MKLLKTILGDLIVGLIALTLGVTAGTVASCVHKPPKEVAVEAAQTVEQTLDTAQDVERSVCFNNPSTRQNPLVGEHGLRCTNPVALTLGLTDERHQAIEKALGEAFTLQGKVAVALSTWTPGSPAPGDLAGLERQVQSALAVAKAIAPAGGKAQTILDDIQAVLDAVNQIISAIGGSPSTGSAS